VDGDTFIEEFGVTGDMPDGRQLESHWAEILTYSDDLVTSLRLYFNPLDFAPALASVIAGAPSELED
jgi:ketosteroid isomerase-like protein